MTREPIFAALFTLLQGASGFQTVGRRYKAISEVPPELQPAMFLTQKSEHHTVTTGQPSKVVFTADVFVYVNTAGDPTKAPSQVLNPILDAVTNLFAAPAPNGKQTLGGLVQYARVSGEVLTDEGVLGDQGFAVIPLEILATL